MTQGAATRLAFVFPGQGSQGPGMGRELAAHFPEAAAVFQESDQVLGFPLSEICFHGTDEDLRRTEVAQPALLTCSVAALRCIDSKGIHAAAAAGHSLGEYSALVAAGALEFAEALRLVRRRGELMAEAGREHPGAMAAVLGLGAAQVAEICASMSSSLPGQGVVAAANFNAPGQVVISGDAEAITAAAEALKTAGASRVLRLNVSGAFHSPLMETAAEKLEPDLARAAVRAPRIPVFANVTGQPVQDPAAIRAALRAQIASSVQWEATIQELGRQQIQRFVEIGPGRVLSGLVRKILPGAATYNVGTPEDLEGLDRFIGEPNAA